MRENEFSLVSEIIILCTFVIFLFFLLFFLQLCVLKGSSFARCVQFSWPSFILLFVGFDIQVTVHRDKFDVQLTVHRDKFDVQLTVHRDKFDVQLTVQRDKLRSVDRAS